MMDTFDMVEAFLLQHPWVFWTYMVACVVCTIWEAWNE